MRLRRRRTVGDGCAKFGQRFTRRAVLPEDGAEHEMRIGIVGAARDGSAERARGILAAPGLP